MTDLQELRRSDDPRTNPDAPYIEGWEHLAEKWPDRLDSEKDYVIAWSEEQDGSLVRCRGRATVLRIARRFAQAVSVREATSPEFAWVLFDDGEEEPETVDVWSVGYWLPPDQWTKEGYAPHPPGENGSLA